MAEIVTVAQLRDYLGVDSDKDPEIGMLLASAAESISRATGTDWTRREKLDTYNEAVRAQVWLSYYAVRDGAKNARFLQDYLTGLISSLQLTAYEEAGPDGVG